MLFLRSRWSVINKLLAWLYRGLSLFSSVPGWTNDASASCGNYSGLFYFKGRGTSPSKETRHILRFAVLAYTRYYIHYSVIHFHIQLLIMYVSFYTFIIHFTCYGERKSMFSPPKKSNVLFSSEPIDWWIGEAFGWWTLQSSSSALELRPSDLSQSVSSTTNKRARSDKVITPDLRERSSGIRLTWDLAANENCVSPFHGNHCRLLKRGQSQICGRLFTIGEGSWLRSSNAMLWYIARIHTLCSD